MSRISEIMREQRCSYLKAESIVKQEAQRSLDPKATEALSAMLDMKGGVMIMAERARQVEGEGYSKSDDAEHRYGQLIMAAVAYANAAYRQVLNPTVKPKELAFCQWPWSPEAWKPGDKIRNLVKAGALLAAEIDRILDEEPEGEQYHTKVVYRVSEEGAEVISMSKPTVKRSKL